MSNVNFLLKRTSTANKRPTSAQLDVGELSMCYEAGDPGIFFEDSNGAVRKVGPATVGATAPNASPAGSSGNSAGELWFDNTGGGSTLKVYDGSSWKTNTIPGITTDTSSVALSIDSSNRVGIGTTSPAAQLELSGDGANASRFFITQANATTDGTDITGRRSRGTLASPESLQNGDAVFKLFAQAHDGSSYVAAGNLGWAATDGNGNSSFSLKTRSGSSVGDRLTIDSSGNAAFSGSLDVNNELTIGSVGSPFQASAANDAITKSYADSTYLTSSTLSSTIQSDLGITRTGTGATIGIDITDITFQRNLKFGPAASFISFQDNESTALRVGDDGGVAYMTFDSSDDAECVEFNKNLCLSAGAQIAMAGSTTITLLDNDNDALDIKEGNNLYMRFNTTNSGEKMQILKNIYLAAELHMASYVLMDNEEDIRFAEKNSNGTNYLALKAPTSLTATTTLTLPDGDGSANQVLKTDGSGTLAWADALIPAASIDPTNNGDLVVEATNDTTITFKLKGSDGTIRTGTITLS